MSLEELFRKKGMLMDVDKAMAHLCQTAEQFGVKMGKRTRTFNSRPAQELGLWAQEKGRGHQFHMAAFQAYFVDGANIASKDVLLKLVDESGLDPLEGEQILVQRTFSEAVDAEWDMAQKAGIKAVPTFRMGLQTLVGAKPYELLDQMVRQAICD